MFDARFHQHAVNYNFNGVILPLDEVNGDIIIEVDQFPVDARPRIAVLDERLHLLLELTLAPADDRRHHHDPIFGRQGHDPLDNLVRGLPADCSSAFRAVRNTDRGEQQAKIIVDFGDGPDGRPRAATRGFLLNRNRGAKSIDSIYIRTLHLIEELTRIGRQRFHVPALAFGVNRVKGEGGLPRPAQSGNHGQRVTRNLDADVFEIVLPGPPDGDFSNGHYLSGDKRLP